jgi:hypothetical protein
MTDTPRPAGVTPPVAVVFATATFLALAIGGLGVASLLLDADVIPVRGLGPLPGVGGMLLALLLFAGVLLWGLRAEPAGYLTAVPCAIGAYVGETLGIAIGAAVTGGDLARGLAAAEAVALGWPGAVIAVSGLLAGAFGVLLVRRRGEGPHWRWERGDDDER